MYAPRGLGEGWGRLTGETACRTLAGERMGASRGGRKRMRRRHESGLCRQGHRGRSAVGGFFGFEDEALHGDGDSEGSAAGAEVQEAGCLPNAVLGGALQVEDQGAGGVSRLEGMQGEGGSVDDDGEFVIEVMRGGGGHGTGAIGFRKAFHIRMVAGGRWAQESRLS